MKFRGESIVSASPAAVWAALHDPVILCQSIRGCESVETVGESGFRAVIESKNGHASAQFKVDMTLSENDPPKAYTISGQIAGGRAGSAKASARVGLEPCGAGTRVAYDIDLQRTGNLAQSSSRHFRSEVKTAAAEFFERFTELVLEAETSSRGASVGVSRWWWLVRLAAVIGAVLYGFFS